MSDIMRYLGGDSNPRRGGGYEQAAKAFIDRYPPGSDISDAQLDAFWSEWDSVNYKPEKRALYAERLRNAGCHSQMRKSGYPAFTIWSDHKGGWKVRTSEVTITSRVWLTEFDKKLAHLETLLKYLGEGVSMDRQPFEVELLRMRYKTHARTLRRAKRELLDAAEELAELEGDVSALMKIRSLQSGEE